ncbi:MAG: hypothetical protein N3F64_06795, partial [Nitrososphaeria archaeon]|nr:hypothetical protein [Nitrososphaeria archaeon]
LITLTIIVLASSVLPFLPTAVSIQSVRSIRENLFPIYQNTGFEEYTGNNVYGWNLFNGSKLSRTIVFEGNYALNLTPSKPFMAPQAIYAGKNASSRYIIGGNLVLSLAVKASKEIVESYPSYIAVQNIILHHRTNITVFTFTLVLYKSIGNLSDGIKFTDYGVILFQKLEDSNDWIEYALQMINLKEEFTEYLLRKGVYAKVEDEYDVVGLSVWSENLVAYVDNLSIYLIEPKWLMVKISSNSILPMNMFISGISINNSVPINYYVKPDIILPFTSFEVYTYVPYIPVNGSKNIFTIKFSTGQTLNYEFIEDTKRVWIRA